MKKFLVFLIAVILAGVMALFVIKPILKPNPDDSGGNVESSTKDPQQSESSGDGEMKITFDVTEWVFKDLTEKDDEDKDDKKVTGVEITPGEIIFGDK